MGLDQYLKAEILLPEYDRLRDEYQTPVTKTLSDLRHVITDTLNLQSSGGLAYGMFETPGTCTIRLDVAYWRKANQVHAWFTAQNDGKLDNCEKMIVSVEQLQQLVDLCEKLLEDRDSEKAAKELPPSDGFFFGSTEINDYYWSDLEQTIKQIKPWLERKDLHSQISFQYYAWW